MQKEIETKREKHYSISIRLPKSLYEQLESKSEELGDIGVSETIRILLSASLKNPDVDFLNPNKTETELNNKIQYKILQNVVTCYYLIKDQIERSEDGLRHSRASHEQGKTAMTKILGQVSEAKS